MGSRHHSLDYSEVKDVTQIVQDFQEHNAVFVKVGFYVVIQAKSPRIVMTAEALTRKDAGAELVRSAYVEVDTYALNLRHWGAAVTHVLYALDAKLAWNEMQPGE